MRVVLFLLFFVRVLYSQDCVCTTVPCPVVGENDIIMEMVDLK